jgi:thiol-disulfide isomerase/thioredoxin
MKKLLILIIIITTAITLSACNQKKTTTVQPTPPPPEVVAEKVAVEAAEKVIESLPEGSSEYIDYTAEKLNEYKGSKPVALFFHATWCPTCRVLNNDLEESLPNLTGMTVLKVDYDTETELKKEYEITDQHTVVFLDASGNIADKKDHPTLNDVINFFSSQGNMTEDDIEEN